MSRALHFAPNTVAGHGPTDTGSLPCLGVYGRATGILCSSTGGDCKSLFPLKSIWLQCSSRKTSPLCMASSSNERLNPDFSRQNRQSSSGGRRWQKNDERESLVNLEERDPLDLKNGPLFSSASNTNTNTNKNKGTSTTFAGPGHREREIIELFRKVQSQLRQRTASKKEKKVEIAREAAVGSNKESEAVDSLLDLLKKHSAEKGSRRVNGESGTNFHLNQSGQRRASGEGKSRNFYNSGGSNSWEDESYDEPYDIDRPLRARPLLNMGDDEIDRPLRVRPPLSTHFRDESRDIDKPSQGRPASNFRRKSPVPRVRYEPVTYPKEAPSDITWLNPDGRSNSSSSSSSYLVDDQSQQDPEIEQEPEFDDELDTESGFTAIDMGGDLSEIDESLDVNEEEHEKMAETNQEEDLNSMNLQSLRALAKTRGLKGYSKMKKMELVGLLSSGNAASLNE